MTNFFNLWFMPVFVLFFLSNLVYASPSKQGPVLAYEGMAESFFCNCQFNPGNLQADNKNCHTNVLNSSPFGAQLNWTHLVREEQLSHDLSCWNEAQNIPECNSKDGVLSPQRCCEATSTEYLTRKNNLHNIVPVLNQLDELRQDYDFAQVYNSPPAFPGCGVKVDKESRRFEPKDDRKGDVARIFFYFESLGYVRLSRRMRPLFEIWDMKDPVSDYECQLHQQKAKLSGNKNPYVANRCP